MAELKLSSISKVYDNKVTAVSDINLHIKDKEFIVIVGPSGCGKSTILRMIAGLEKITDGDFFMNGQRMNDFPPKDRNIAMVFQNYALYPHMTVFDNMAFGLKLRKLPRAEITERVNQAAAILGLESLLERKPKALSGGQQQRVALGRAIVRDAQVFLMDEPLSNLDAKLRAQMRSEIKKIHKQLHTTTVYVTHDQTEAMTMATRLIVMKDGHIQQIGTPEEVYGMPNNVFVGSFIGSPPMNFFKGVFAGKQLLIGDHQLEIPENKIAALRNMGYSGKAMLLGMRPDDLSVDHSLFDIDKKNCLPATAEMIELTGADLLIHFTLSGQTAVIRTKTDNKITQGECLRISFDMEKAHFFDMESTERIPLIC